MTASKPGKDPVFIVGIGASAGGLEAFEALLPTLPTRHGMAFVLIQHQDASQPSALSRLLTKFSVLPVVDVKAGMTLAAETLYVCPPGQRCTVEDRHFSVNPFSMPGPRHGIDILFSSLAQNYPERCIGILLSGTGQDGILGAQEIKAAGGWVLAQAPETAAFRALPEALINLYLTDFIRTPEAMGQELLELVRLSRQTVDAALPDDTDMLRILLELLENETGFNFQRYKGPMLLRRIKRRLVANHIDSLGEYLQLVRQSRDEARRLIKDIFIAVTGFFRDRKVFERLDALLLEMADRKGPDGTLRIWSAGCATGEEAYSLALLVEKFSEKLEHAPAVKIFATDIDPDNIDSARRGIYAAKAVENVPSELLQRYFEKRGDAYQVGKELRERVIFAVHDVTTDAPFSKLDLLCCRNLLIYFNRQTQARLMTRFRYALNPGAYLQLGVSESIGKTESLFKAVDAPLRLYQRLGPQNKAAEPLLPARPDPAVASHLPVSPLLPALSWQQQMRELVFAEYAQVAVLVNRRLELMHVHGRVQPYLSLPEGDVKLDLLHMAVPELRAAMRMVLQQAQRQGVTVRSRPLRLVPPNAGGRRANDAQVITLVAIPQPKSATRDRESMRESGEILLIFESAVGPNLENPVQINAAAAGQAQMLEQELAVTRDQLQASMEALEAANQELQSISEEYQSTTEELQSANEEYQTTNEELESTNAELLRLNAELTKLEKESQLLAAVVHTSDDAIIVQDMDGIISNWNAGAQNMFQYSPEQAHGMALVELLDASGRRPYQAYIRKLLRGHGKKSSEKRIQKSANASLEIRGLTRGGKILELWLNASVLVDQQQKPGSIALTLRDITDKKATENKLKALVESTPDPIIIVEADGMIQRVNRQAEILFGYSRKDLLGKSYQRLIPERFRRQHDGHHQRYRENPMMRQMGSGLELWCLTRSGEEIPVEIGLSPVLVGNEATTLVRFRDIRQQQQEQMLLRSARQQADEANRTKSRFLAAASHDLRQPLQSISMCLGVLSGKLSIGEKARVLAQARMAVDTTNKLLNALLNITKLESGKVEVNICSFNVFDMLQRVYNTEAQQAREKALKFSLVKSSAIISSDAALLEEVLTNLVANAIKFTPAHGHIVLGCRRHGDSLKIQVFDNGPGIPSTALDEIFDEYQQLEQGGHYLGKGLGLGLSIVKLIAEFLQLKLDVRSIPGRGSVFSVLVPLATGKSLPHTRQEPVPVLSSDRSSATLLLIEDDPAVLDSTSLFLELSGFTVVTARNSAEVQARIAISTPDLIISDYGLAQAENGLQLVRTIRQQLDRRIPAIIVTGDTSERRSQEAKDASCEIICKPIEAQFLLQLIQKQLQGTSE
ncbi:MAG: CheR family methyltransferase [Pseudomonadales bacterium]|nr:CheR family methyltransferase [Pseudomonadales bacterium]